MLPKIIQMMPEDRVREKLDSDDEETLDLIHTE
jgi:hypothetical protein